MRLHPLLRSNDTLRMRILYLHQYFATPQSSGGTRSYEFARRLIAKGHQVQFISSPGYLPEEYKKLAKTTTIDFDGIPVTVIPVAYSNQMSFPRRVSAFLSFAWRASWEAMRHKPDLVFATSTPLTIAIPGILTKLRRRCPMVFEVRDLWPELPIAIGALKNPILRRAASALEWIAYHSARHVVALSPGMAEGVRRRGVKPDRVTVIPNSCDTAVFDVPRERGAPVRQKLGLGDRDPLVVYAGTFGHINGVSYLVDLAAAVGRLDPEVRFLIVGGGAEREQVHARAGELGIVDKNLTLWDSVPKEEMPNVLAAADIVTSVFVPLEPMWNNSANKFFDALSARKPIAINYGGWQKTILEETGAGIALPPDDIEHAAARLVAFARDTARLAKASEASRQLAYERFSRDLMAEKLEHVFKRVVTND